MTDIDPTWSLESLLREFRPHKSWRSFFADAYVQAMEALSPEEQLNGWRTAAMIFGDMNECLFCLIVSYHGRSLVPPESKDFLGNIDLCLWSMNLAAPVQAVGAVRAVDVGEPDTFRREDQAVRDWLDEQLRPFNGDLAVAARFAMRLTAIRLGLLSGPARPSIEQVLDASLWRRVTDTAANPSTSGEE